MTYPSHRNAGLPPFDLDEAKRHIYAKDASYTQTVLRWVPALIAEIERLTATKETT